MQINVCTRDFFQFPESSFAILIVSKYMTASFAQAAVSRLRLKFASRYRPELIAARGLFPSSWYTRSIRWIGRAYRQLESLRLNRTERAHLCGGYGSWVLSIGMLKKMRAGMHSRPNGYRFSTVAFKCSFASSNENMRGQTIRCHGARSSFRLIDSLRKWFIHVLSLR
jgi:hypothetical protein